MQKLTFSASSQEKLNILCLGAHCDDIEIGCGGTLLKLIEEYNKISINWVVFTSNEIRKEEAISSAEQFLENARQKKIKICDFKDGFLPSVWSEVKNTFENLKGELSPDIIFTHYRNDLHQDHRTLNELTWNTFRNHLILEYEIPKYDGDIGNPNFFVPIEEDIVNRKIQLILDHYITQQNKHWLDKDLLNSLMRLRGMESVSPSNYAEAFYSRKICL